MGRLTRKRKVDGEDSNQDDSQNQMVTKGAQADKDDSKSKRIRTGDKGKPTTSKKNSQQGEESKTETTGTKEKAAFHEDDNVVTMEIGADFQSDHSEGESSGSETEDGSDAEKSEDNKESDNAEEGKASESEHNDSQNSSIIHSNLMTLHHQGDLGRVGDVIAHNVQGRGARKGDDLGLMRQDRGLGRHQLKAGDIQEAVWNKLKLNWIKLPIP